MTINYPEPSANDDILASDFALYRKDLIRNAGDYGVTGGSANAQTLAIDGAIVGGDIIDSFKVRFKAGFTTTSTTPTLNVNATGAVVMLDRDGNTFPVNGLRAGGIYEATFDGTNWLVTNNVVINDRILQFTAETDLSPNTVVSRLKNDPTKVEQTSLRFFSEGALDTETVDSTSVICGISRRQSIAVYIAGGQMRARAITVERDKTLTLESASANITACIEIFQVLKVAENKVLVSYEESASVHKLIVLEVDTDGVTILNGAIQTVTASVATARNFQCLALFGTDSAVIAYPKGTSLISMRHIGIATRTITLGAEFITTQVNTWVSASNLFVECLDSVTAVVAFVESTSGDIRTEIASLSGTTLSSVATNLRSTTTPTLAGIYKIKDGEALVTTTSSNLGIHATTTTLTTKNPDAVSGANYSIPLGKTLYPSEDYFYLLPTGSGGMFTATARNDQMGDAVKISNNTFLNNAQHAIMCQEGVDDGIRILIRTTATGVALYEHYGNLKGVMGIINDSYSKGDTVNVYINSICMDLTGLTANQIYYADKDGVLTTDKGFVRIGKSMSTTEMAVKIEKTIKAKTSTIQSQESFDETHLLDIRDDWDTVESFASWGQSGTDRTYTAKGVMTNEEQLFLSSNADEDLINNTIAFSVSFVSIGSMCTRIDGSSVLPHIMFTSK